MSWAEATALAPCAATEPGTTGRSLEQGAESAPAGDLVDVDPDDLSSGPLATDDVHVSTSHAERIGHRRTHGIVGLTVNRARRHRHNKRSLATVPVGAADNSA